MGKSKKETLISLFVLFIAVFGIVITNYHPGTFLTGWDDLHSEFNLLEHFKRSIFSLWQEHHGTGDLIGSGYAADIPRLLYLWMLSLVLPVDMIRYSFHFSMLLVGTVGTYVAIKTFFVDRGGRRGNIAAIFGALFYLLNLGTVQYFATPFEPFSTFWGMFPWMIYATLRYLKIPSRKNIIIFALIHFLATPSVYVFTIFYVYLSVFILLLVSYIIHNRKKQAVKAALIACVLFFCVNAFWLLPHVYWVITSRSVQQNATLNKLTTDEVYERTMQFGNLSDFVLFRNKPWDYQNITSERDKFVIQPWHDHMANFTILALGYLFFFISVLGIFTTKSYRVFVISFAVISFLSLANQTPIAHEFNTLFRKISIVNQVLRDPFTKFIVPILFIFAVGFSGGIIFLSRFVPAKLVKPLGITGSVILTVMFVSYGLPAYKGHFIADIMRNKTPEYYFEFFDYMKTQDPTKRIADLPQGPIWGWESYTWGYTGSGFLWHGLNQPLLNRTFDVWNDKNEEYYWEMLYAINKRDYVLFHNVLKKYQIGYVMFSSSMYFPDNPNSAFTILRQKQFIDNDPILKKVKTFGKIDLYETQVNNKNYVAIVEDAPTVVTNTNWIQNDKAYAEYGDYIADKNGQSEVVYPYRSLFSGRGSSDINYDVEQNQNAFIFKASIPDGQIIIPKDLSNEFIKIDPKSLKISQQKPQIFNNNSLLSIDSSGAAKRGKLNIIINKATNNEAYDSNLQQGQFLGTDSHCTPGTEDKLKESSQKLMRDDLTQAQFFRMSSIGTLTCRVIYLPGLPNRNGYIIGIKSRNIEGNTIHFWVEYLTDKRSDPQIFLKKQAEFGWEYFIIPPMVQDGLGYSLHFDNSTVGKYLTINDLAQVVIYPIPYNFLTNIRVSQNSTTVTTSSVTDDLLDSVDRISYDRYKIHFTKEKSFNKAQTLVLFQSYDIGWKAYMVDGWLGNAFPMLFGKPLKDHIMVNNWANGWDISDLKSQIPNLKNNQIEIIIIFWPQYLEYLGFILLPVPFIYAFWPRKKSAKG